MSFDYLVMGRWIVFAAISFYLVYRFRDLIRNLALRLIPVRRRITHDSFRLQTRYAIIMSFGLGTALTLLLNLGYCQVFPYAAPALVANETRVLPTPVPSPTPLTVVPPVLAPAPVVRTVQDTVVALEERPRVTRLANHYLQVNAFSDHPTAERNQQRLQGQHQISVRVVYLPATAQPPYKVLLGPFDSPRAVQDYQARYGLEGFYRSLQE